MRRSSRSTRGVRAVQATITYRRMGHDRGSRDSLVADFGRQVRDALLHVYDPVYLQTHALVKYLRPEPEPRSRTLGKRLQRTILDAIESFQPSDGLGRRRERSYL